MTPPSNPTNDTSRRIVWGAIFLAIAVGGTFAYQHFTSLYHLATVQPGVLYRDGARSAGELKRAIGRVMPKTVVCLVDDREVSDPAKPQFKAEFDFLAERKIVLERIPIRDGGWPTTSDVQRFLTIMAKPENQPVLVHCAQGVRRTGMMVAAFQISVLGYDKKRAKDEIMTFDHSNQTIDDIRRFIDGYDARSRTVASDLK